VPFPAPRSVTWDIDLTDAGRFLLGLGPQLSTSQQRGAVELDPNHTIPDLDP